MLEYAWRAHCTVCDTGLGKLRVRYNLECICCLHRRRILEIPWAVANTAMVYNLPGVQPLPLELNTHITQHLWPMASQRGTLQPSLTWARRALCCCQGLQQREPY